jgi:Ulp1 protease family, C-terminal catalytic domain
LRTQRQIRVDQPPVATVTDHAAPDENEPRTTLDAADDDDDKLPVDRVTEDLMRLLVVHRRPRQEKFVSILQALLHDEDIQGAFVEGGVGPLSSWQQQRESTPLKVTMNPGRAKHGFMSLSIYRQYLNRSSGKIRWRHERQSQWKATLQRLEQDAQVSETLVSSWEEVRLQLTKVLNFSPAAPPLQANDTGLNEFEKSMQDLSFDHGRQRMLRGWQRAADFCVTDGVSIGPDLLRQHQERLSLLASQAVQSVEAKMREREAQKVLQSILRDFEPDERALLNEFLYGPGPPTEILAQIESETIQRQNFATLQPGQWLSDEVIHGFLELLAQRDARLGREKRSHFFKSFFMTKLLNEGHRDRNVDGTYDYKNVKRWSKKVPGKGGTSRSCSWSTTCLLMSLLLACQLTLVHDR